MVNQPLNHDEHTNIHCISFLAGLYPALMWEHQIYQTSLRQWNVSIPTTLATIIGICKTISSIVVKISFGIHLKRLTIFFSVSIYTANIASPI